MDQGLTGAYKTADGIIDFETLLADLPGTVGYAYTPAIGNSDHVVEIHGDDPVTGTRKFDCRFGFNFHAGRGESSVKNCSIHDSRERGRGLGAQIIANLLHTTRASPALHKITLTAELERGAFVWAKMGWLPHQTSFARLQRKCQPKLDLLQQLIPHESRLSPGTYGIFRDLLDSESSPDPKYIWAMVDSNASYRLEDLTALQNIAQLADSTHRRHKIQERAQANGITFDASQLVQADKTLTFMRNLDLAGLSKDGKIPVAVVLFAWEQWKGELNLHDADQMDRVEARLNKARPSSAPTVSTKTQGAQLPPPKVMHA